MILCSFIVFSFGSNTDVSNAVLNPSSISSDFEETFKTELLNRSLDLEIRKEKLSKIAQSCGIASKTENSIEEALKNVANESENAIIFCTGSLYLIGEILNLN